MDDRLSVERFWFSNTLLLGFDAAENEKKYRVAFSHDMFKNPNLKGMEVVLHFLFSKLYPTRMNELLKHVWPINDHNQGKQYKQIIGTLLQELKDKLDLPPIVSTLQSCSGKRFYDLLWKLSYYVLQTVMQKNFSDYAMPAFPAVDLNTNSQTLLDLISVTQLYIARQARMFVSHAQGAVSTQENWKQFDKTMYDEYNALTEELANVKKEQAKLAEKVDLSGLVTPEAKETREKRIADIRKMWQVAEDFNSQVTNNKESYADILSGNAYPHQLNASDLHIDKIPEELAGIAAPLLLPTTNDKQAPQFTLDGLFTLFNSALSFLSLSLPPASPPLPICTEAPRLAEWAKTQNLQLASIGAFGSELTHQAVSWRIELQEARELRASIDSALHNRNDDDRFRMQPLPPPTSYFDDRSMHEKREITPKELGFASPASRAPKQDVLEKLANSVKRVALRGNRTFAAIANELLPPDFASEDTQDFSFSTMSTINPDTFFAIPATPAPPTQQSSANRKLSTATQRLSIMHAPLYNRPPLPTPSTTYRPPTKKSVPKPYTSTKPPTSTHSHTHTYTPLHTPSATSDDGSAPNLSSIFSQSQKSEAPAPKTRTSIKRSALPPATTTSTSTPAARPPATKKPTHKREPTTKPRPSATDLLVNEMAAYMSMSPDDEDSPDPNGAKSSKPKPSGFRTGPSSRAKVAWEDDQLHFITDTLDAIDGTAFKTTKQLPRTPLPHEKTTKSKNRTPEEAQHTQAQEISPANFFNGDSVYSDDVEWNQFINNSNHTSPKPKLTKNSPFSSTKTHSPPLSYDSNNNSTNYTSTNTTPTNNHSPNNNSAYNSTKYDSPNYNPPKYSSTTTTTTTSSPSNTSRANGHKTPKTSTKPHHDEPIEMDYDTGSVDDSPMHMNEWLSTARPTHSPSLPLPLPLSSSSIFDELGVDSLYPAFSTNLSFSNDLPKAQERTRTPQKNTSHSIFATPADEPYDFR
eukprot:Phypoly_transcript_01967.p1 GENE.Phypoly_transcript_01967~~Phypoly_transcript_01967.p1  ORF type:complete len:976 (-),score=205.64 Phypoly_transcript_01967:29-2956(-)